MRNMANICCECGTKLTGKQTYFKEDFILHKRTGEVEVGKRPVCFNHYIKSLYEKAKKLVNWRQ